MMFKKTRLLTYVASVTVIVLVLHGSLQAQPRTCDEIQASIVQERLKYNQHIANKEKAQADKACLAAVLVALSEAQAAFDALDESARTNSSPTVQYPECSDIYGPLTVEQATTLAAAASEEENEAKTGIMTSVLELAREKASYNDGCS